MMKKVIMTAALLALAVLALAATPAYAAGTMQLKANMHRLYNPNNGEHFYTSDPLEKGYLVAAGWNYEGIGWQAPEESSTPVHRLYNPNAGDHHYTTDAGERDMLESVGWIYEGVGWYSDDARGVALYRQYNPNAASGSHNYTTSEAENDFLVSVGWRAEGVGWYGADEGTVAVSASGSTSVATSSVMSSPTAEKTSATAPKYSYDAFFVDSAGSQTLTSTSKIVFIRTANPDPSTIKVSQTKLCVAHSPLSYDLLDVNFTGNDAGSIRSVEGGYLASVCYAVPGENSIYVSEDVNGEWVIAGKWTVQVEDDAAAEEAWCRRIIDEATDEEMNPYEKLDATAEWLTQRFTYPANMDRQLVKLARTPGKYFQSLSWDSYTSPKVLARIAEMIGGFDEVTNMYGQYQRGTADWQRMHHYVRVVYKGITHYVSACPDASTGALRMSDIKKIDFSDTSKLTPLSRE